jgi:hypothetical protein
LACTGKSENQKQNSNFAVAFLGVESKVSLKKKEYAWQNCTKQKTWPHQTTRKRELKRFSK